MCSSDLLRTSTSGRLGSIPGQGTKILQAVWPKNNNNNNNKIKGIVLIHNPPPLSPFSASASSKCYRFSGTTLLSSLKRKKQHSGVSVQLRLNRTERWKKGAPSERVLGSLVRSAVVVCLPASPSSPRKRRTSPRKRQPGAVKEVAAAASLPTALPGDLYHMPRSSFQSTRYNHPCVRNTP